eukprot:14429998-Alexandrium_andersonii.AAC.1
MAVKSASTVKAEQGWVRRQLLGQALLERRLDRAQLGREQWGEQWGKQWCEHWGVQWGECKWAPQE